MGLSCVREGDWVPCPAGTQAAHEGLVLPRCFFAVVRATEQVLARPPDAVERPLVDDVQS